MEKFLLIIQVCSTLIGQCMPPITTVQEYNSQYECLHAGALNMIEIAQTLGSDYVNEQKIIINFSCLSEFTS